MEAYYKENMGLVTHLQYAVQKEKEEEPEEEPGKSITISFVHGFRNTFIVAVTMIMYIPREQNH